jgi:ketosteroid isomerase-like protein
LFLVFMVFFFPSLAQEHNDDESEVWTIVRRWNKAFAANEVNEYFNYLHDDATVIVPSNPYRIDSKERDREEFVWSLSKGLTNVQFFQEIQPKVQIFGSTAIVTYYSRGVYGNQQTMVYLKETDILIKEGSKWKIIHIHVSRT